MNSVANSSILKNPHALINKIAVQLNQNGRATNWRLSNSGNGIKDSASAVLFLITIRKTVFSSEPEICILLNKRSPKILQPGDLCCPGGGVKKKDKLISRIMPLPFSPFQKWARRYQQKNPKKDVSNRIALMLTTGLREAWEEMRLNPLSVSLLGPLPVHQLMMFEKKIYPLVTWIPGNLKLQLNWEVERIVYIPIRHLLDPINYGRYRLTFKDAKSRCKNEHEFPCFVHHDFMEDEILWGVTFRITMNFLSIIFNFFHPDLETLPIVRGRRSKGT